MLGATDTTITATAPAGAREFGAEWCTRGHHGEIRPSAGGPLHSAAAALIVEL